MAKYSKEDKELLIAEFNDSGLGISEWCHQKQLPVSTFSGWINKRNSKNKDFASAKFVEIKTTAPAGNLKMSIGNIDIEVTPSTDLNLLAKLIKVVNSINV